MSMDEYIFGKEISPVLEMVREHRPLAEVEALVCPRCNASLTVCFDTNGYGFSIYCTANDPHMSRHEVLLFPPDWWRQRIANFEPVTYYWPMMSEVATDGTITMRSTGWSEEGHWTGVYHVRSEQSDYLFWRWIISQRARWPQFFSDRNLLSLKQEFASLLH